MTDIVYFILKVDPFGQSRIKIGKTNNIKIRFAELQRYEPAKLELLHTVKCRSYIDATALEGALHLALAPQRAYNEWFGLAREHAEIIALVAGAATELNTKDRITLRTFIADNLEKINDLKTKKARLEAQIMALQMENAELKTENAKLKAAR